MIIILLTLASILIVILLYNWYQNNKMENVVHEVCVEGCKIDRYEKSYYEELGIWEIKDRLNNKNPIVGAYGLPKDIAEEIMDYSLKLLIEGKKK